MRKLFWKIPFYNMPFKFKKFIAKILLHSFKSGNMPNDIVLYNELQLWIKTDGRPSTSNINYHINTH